MCPRTVLWVQSDPWDKNTVHALPTACGLTPRDTLEQATAPVDLLRETSLLGTTSPPSFPAEASLLGMAPGPLSFLQVRGLKPRAQKWLRSFTRPLPILGSLPGEDWPGPRSGPRPPLSSLRVVRTQSLWLLFSLSSHPDYSLFN